MFQYFGLPVSNETKQDFQLQFEQFFSSGKKGVILATLNPEMLLAARSNPKFWRVLKSAWRVVDGVGLIRLSQGRLKHRLTGSQIFEIILQSLPVGTRVLLLGGAGEEARLTAVWAAKQYPELKIISDSGGLIELKNTGWQQDPLLLSRLKIFAPQIIFAALGHEKQELWLYDHLPQLPSVHLGIGVGGIFAFYAGTLIRAPKIWQRFGLEWLWRLLAEPKRWPRIGRAVIIFPIVHFWDKISHKKDYGN